MTNATNTFKNTLSITEAIEKAHKAESLCRDILLPRNRTALNPDFTISSLPRVPGKAGLQLMDPALKQVVRTVAGMPARAVEWMRDNGLGEQAASCYNQLAGAAGDGKLKFRLYSTESLNTKAYAVVTEGYQEFPKSEILEAVRLGMGEWIDVANLQVGIEGLNKNGRFGETVIAPWELNVCIPMETFEGPRGDVYDAGIAIRERGDGTAGCDVLGFLHRRICNNGLVQDKYSAQFSICHKGKNSWAKLQRSIARAIAGVARNLPEFQASLGMLPTISLENPFAALVAVAEKDLGERRVMQARQILDTYVQEMGSTAEAVVNTITHLGTADKVDSIREVAQALGGKALVMSPRAWQTAEARGLDIIQARVSLN